MTPLRVAIADDEPLARRRLRSLLEKDAEVSIVAECRNGDETLEALQTGGADLFFLDVQMPGIDGLSAIERIEAPSRPHVVLVTAHDHYAVRAFELHAVDYLLKPYDDDRFRIALGRAKNAARGKSGDAWVRALALLEESRRDGTTIPVRTARGATSLVAIESIEWIESADNYVHLHVGQESHLMRSTMVEIERRLPASRFVRVHRRAIVNLRHVRELQPSAHGDFRVVLQSGSIVPLSRRYRGNVEARLGTTL